MDIDDYQKQIIKFDTFPHPTTDPTDPAFLEKILGLPGEAGEVADKFKKIIRDDSSEITPENKQEIKKELGDTLWYIATIAHYLDLPLSEIAESNISKLESRQLRGKLHGSGDNR
ncbi:nucleoside triphosphate pyrophosphohydrolase family protein [Candidatus Saccharibacteria bacterium]|nr:nucleoside triphosphate pyrophosphohydrolase family protein [Candidatus Saccharibacteria bacterium]